MKKPKNDQNKASVEVDKMIKKIADPTVKITKDGSIGDATGHQSLPEKKPDTSEFELLE